MAFIDRILQVPSYGWKDKNNELIIPTNKTLFKEAFSRINIFKSKKNWISLMSWMVVVSLLPFFIVFVLYYVTVAKVIVLFFYGMFFMSTHGTIWLHRYSTHNAYKFSHPIWRFITQNLVIKTVPEEIYVISHHVHHAKSDEPGDPYNARGGFLYCMLADVNHQSIAKDLSEEEYKSATVYMKHVGVRMNNYKKYLKWGSVSVPFNTVFLLLCNWTFWYTAFYFIGGHGLSCAMFSAAMFWFVLVRAFNYTGHGKGEEMHQDGIDYDRRNLSINQTRPGYFSGEWHNNHHLYPQSARSGFLPYQLDMAWVYIYLLSKVGMVSSYNDSKKSFFKKYVNSDN